MTHNESNITNVTPEMVEELENEGIGSLCESNEPHYPPLNVSEHSPALQQHLEALEDRTYFGGLDAAPWQVEDFITEDEWLYNEDPTDATQGLSLYGRPDYGIAAGSQGQVLRLTFVHDGKEIGTVENGIMSQDRNGKILVDTRKGLVMLIRRSFGSPIWGGQTTTGLHTRQTVTLYQYNVTYQDEPGCVDTLGSYTFDMGEDMRYNGLSVLGLERIADYMDVWDSAHHTVGHTLSDAGKAELAMIVQNQISEIIAPFQVVISPIVPGRERTWHTVPVAIKGLEPDFASKRIGLTQSKHRAK